MFRQFATLVTFVLVLPAAIWGQGYPASIPPPPIPTGPVLTDVPRCNFAADMAGGRRRHSSRPVPWTNRSGRVKLGRRRP